MGATSRRPGTLGHVAIISDGPRGGPAPAIATIESILGALGVGYRTQGHRIALPGRRVAFAVLHQASIWAKRVGLHVHPGCSSG